ncbi:hypothetical protein MHPYR_180046 [uncultured Mycobacterium sp.]|uniref:DUF7257 domain-containing protein n=1 Tax=uncultured Mycobacterium sp. TaxID=171292 RepID=A0A1Y5P4X4_9MYCO|nr:hypothetical protein MHPYR_180046 [uncultured Mycobacterium sp.]
MSSIAWPPSVDIHTLFGPDLTPPGGLDWNKIQAFARFALESFIGQIAIAFGGINIAGWKPFDFLADWGHDRIAEAQANYLAATNAQDSADYANSQLTGLLATDVSGGVSLSSGFDGPAATGIGGSFTIVYSGSGGGNWALDGAGNTKWVKNGGLSRTGIARHNTPLATDYQRIRLVLKQIPNPDAGGGGPVNIIAGRINSACTTYVFVRFSRTAITLACFVSGSGTVFATDSTFAPTAGDVFDFYLGTENDPREFIVKCNGNEITALTYTDSSAVSSMGSTTRYPGLGCIATGNVFDQQGPGTVTAWGAIDRQAATH